MDKNTKKVFIVDRPEHQRREWATFVKAWPKIKFINCPADESNIYTQKMLDLCVAEIERLKRYAIKGDINRQTFPQKVVFAWKFLGSKIVDKF